MKNMTYWTQHQLGVTDSGQVFGTERMNDFDKEQALKALEEAPEGFNWKPATRNGHYTASQCLPCVVGTRWTVSEEVYNDMLGCLPPLRLPSLCVSQPFVCGFAISEVCTGDIRSAFYKTAGGKYWHEYITLRHD